MFQKIKYPLIISALLGVTAAAAFYIFSGSNVKAEKKPEFDSAVYQTFLKKRLSSADSSWHISAKDTSYFDSLRHFYAFRNYEPYILKDFRDTLFASAIIRRLNGAKDHGIKPEIFKTALINGELAELRQYMTTDIQKGYQHLANLENLLSYAALKYASAIRYGVVNPAGIWPGTYLIPQADTLRKEILRPFRQPDLLAYFDKIQPKSQRYIKLQNALKLYSSLGDTTWKPVPAISGKFKIGDKSSSLKALTQRLIQLGFTDTVKTPLRTGDKFTKELKDAVCRFQRACALKDDGVIGKETIDRLNRTPSDMVEKIKFSLERFRWTSYPDTSRYVLVNIPEFYLRIMDKESEKVKIKVCTGKKYPYWDYKPEPGKKKAKLPNNWETPILYSRISHLVLNPTWTVPTNIVKDEIYVGVMKDSMYLQKKGFRVMRNGKPVSLTQESLKKYRADRVPFTFVQGAGAGNALGKIKFMFNNPFSIYLHDTPTRAPFSQLSRAVSHGCVRLEKPFDLAEYILKDNSKWDIDFIKIEAGYKVDDPAKIEEFKQKRNELRRSGADGKSTRVNLLHKIPVYIDYYTSWVNDEGMVCFRDDVYNKDKILKRYFPL
ncbi:MAG: L,D-transpeptidase family protein [Syntrophothermus sp.]